MEQELELKDIAGYFPYETYGFVNNNAVKIVGMTCIVDEKSVTILGEKFIGITTCKLSDVKLILRPISDLYKTIIHNGKEIIPIVELAKISTNTLPDREWKIVYSFDGIYYAESKYSDKFRYNEKYNAFMDKGCLTGNQYELFDYLHELKIDYRGLIDSGLAVDVNTLDVNYYKLNARLLTTYPKKLGLVQCLSLQNG